MENTQSTPIPPTPPSPPSKIDVKALDVLGIISKLLVPGAVALLITKILKFSEQVQNTTAVSAFVITSIVLFLPESFRRLIIALLASLCVVLGIALLTEQGNKQGFVYDQWQSWENNVRNSLKYCESDDCIIKAIKSTYPQNNNDIASVRLTNDLRAGTFFLKNDTIFKMLDNRLGIKKHFLGTGFALSNNETPYYNARVAEYLIPNLTDSDQAVATWEFSPIAQNFNLSVKDVIMRNGPYRCSTDINKFRQSILNNINQELDTDKPAVIRIAQLTRARYSGMLGRQEAKRVFSLHLGTVWNLKIGELNKLSGYTIKPDPSHERLLFIWVFLPSHPDEVVPATWSNVVKDLDTWLRPD